MQIYDPFFAAHLMSSINNFLISLQEELMHTLSSKAVCLWKMIVSEQNHSSSSDKLCNIQICSRKTTDTWVKNPLVFKGISVEKKKACLFSSFCFCGHLNKDSIFLLEPCSTAVGKEKLPSALKYVPLQVVTHATKMMIISIKYIWSKCLRKILPPHKYFNNGRQICLG